MIRRLIAWFWSWFDRFPLPADDPREWNGG